MTAEGWTAAELAAEREAQAEGLPSRAAIYPKSATVDETGGQAPAWSTARDTNVPARIGDPSGSERDRGDRIVTSTTRVLTLEWGTTLEATDRVVIGATTYEVVADLTVPDVGTAVRALVESVA